MEYLCDECDKKGVSKGSEVLSHEERAGMDELKEGIASKGWMI